jgi:hypothetical protein
MSGKAKFAAPAIGAAIREMTRSIEESEGHVAEFAASLLPERGALAAPNLEATVFLITAIGKRKISKALAGS